MITKNNRVKCARCGEFIANGKAELHILPVPITSENIDPPVEDFIHKKNECPLPGAHRKAKFER